MIPAGCKKVEWHWNPLTPKEVNWTREKIYRLSLDEAAEASGISVAEWEDIEAGRRHITRKEWLAFCVLTDYLDKVGFVIKEGPGRPLFEPKDMYLEQQICLVNDRKQFVSVGNRLASYRAFMAMNWPFDPSRTMNPGDELWVVCTDEGEWGTREEQGAFLQWFPPPGQPMSRGIGILRGNRLRDMPYFQPSKLYPDFDMARPGIS
ncbi:UDP-N-acetylmuramoylalanine--D-glutamate ligase [Burkholderiales bacterium GJ-E10]|nr:UDP-N-acetylmuramoylalanine--D-glutamate ligase [Burkholderiales bacterium GJ-E10]